MQSEKLLLCILDGFGYRSDIFGNATLSAKFITDLIHSDNCKLLKASGLDVGLPEGQFGNSEVGHMTIGAGRIFMQKLPLIDNAIKSRNLEKNQLLLDFISKISNNSINLMGLFSKGGVHSDIDHYFWAIKFFRDLGINIKCHLFLDGRDVGYRDALKTLSNALILDKIKLSEIATIQGRFYAMDRDKRMDRTQTALDAIVNGKSDYITDNPLEVIENFYKSDINDETVPPIIMSHYKGSVSDDCFWMLNFRTDRIKQILVAMQNLNFKILNMVECGQNIDKLSPCLFKSTPMHNTFGEILSKNQVSQLRIAETEKYAHVTYFFDGGAEVNYDLEQKILIPSPQINDYSETPEMSANEITNNIINCMKTHASNVIIANYANPDMLGHTGNFQSTCLSIVLLDKYIKQVTEEAQNSGYNVIITSDHGNAEEMINNDKTPHKTHTTALVPFVFLPIQNSEYELIKTNTSENFSLSDVCPSALTILKIPQPEEMTGKSLIVRKN